MLTAKAVLLRLNEQKREALQFFENNRYITIHSYGISPYVTNNDPYTVWVDLNFPVYKLVGGKPVLDPNGVKNVFIKYSPCYPEVRPEVYLPVNLASIHSWESLRKVGNTDYFKACLHSVYNPDTHNLIKEITNLMALAANCPEAINERSPTPDHLWLKNWTEKSLRAGLIPTVPYKELFRKNTSSKRRAANSVVGV